MDTTTPCMEALFAQLGLPTEAHEIRAFITTHRPLDNAVPLNEAPFWSTAQAALLRQKLAADDDWAHIVDTLNSQLREHPDPAALARG
jgi:hypothetical protein